MKVICKTFAEIPFCILLTQVDILCEQILTPGKEQLLFRSSAVKDAMEMCAAKFGIPQNQVYPLKNYHRETDPVLAIDVLALHTSLKLMDMADAANMI